jgi:Fe2+ or Zn2+ uptake regulation protein
MHPVDATQALVARGIQPSAQRVAVAGFVLDSTEHPSADVVFARVKQSHPNVSRATVYNTLNALVRVGLLRELVLSEGRVVFDPKLAPHHHFVDDDTGAITDIPWDKIPVGPVDGLPGLVVREHQVVLRGRRLPT